jgi:hypothetical protein
VSAPRERLAAAGAACVPGLALGALVVLDPAFLAYAGGTLLGKAAIAYGGVSGVAGIVVAWRGPTRPPADDPSRR